ncbi:MAG: DoxX family protein [Sphingomonas sp.]
MAGYFGQASAQGEWRMGVSGRAVVWGEAIAYWVATLIMFAIMALAIIGYQAQYANFSRFFVEFGYPTYIIYPLAYLKLGALIAIAANRYRNLKDIAYGAYFINMGFATVAHLRHGDTPIHAYVGFVAIIISYVLSNRVRGEPRHDAFVLPKRRQAR